jgi:hypothetical protein
LAHHANAQWGEDIMQLCKLVTSVLQIANHAYLIFNYAPLVRLAMAYYQIILAHHVQSQIVYNAHHLPTHVLAASMDMG